MIQDNSNSRITRRSAMTALGGIAAVSLISPLTAFSQTRSKFAKVAVLAPLTGPYALNGKMYKDGAEMAVEDINAAGGLKILGGVPMELVTYDCGDSVEKARNATGRMLSENPDLIGASGCFLSSFTLAATEVTEQASLPFLTLSYSDLITARGFHYVFQTSSTGSEQAKQLLPAAKLLYRQTHNGKDPKTAALIMDNTASPISTAKPWRDHGFKDNDLKIVLDQTFTPPIADPSGIVQQLRRAKPDILFLMVADAPDCALFLNKMAEFGIGKGVIPTHTGGGHMSSPDVLKLVSPDNINRYFDYVANWTGKGLGDLKTRFDKKYNVKWMSQDNISTYGDMWILKTAAEKANSLDRKAVADAIRHFDGSEGLNKFYAGGEVKFDKNGRRVGASIVILQWQNGVAHSVYPLENAEAKVI